MGKATEWLFQNAAKEWGNGNHGTAILNGAAGVATAISCIFSHPTMEFVGAPMGVVTKAEVAAVRGAIAVERTIVGDGTAVAARGAGALAEGATSRIAQVTEGQLNKFLVKPGHGTSFGLSGNWNPGRVGEISRVINQHINAEGTLAIQGAYRGANVTHFLNPSTGLNVIVDSKGAFVSGWALGAEQQASVLFTGRLF